MISKGRGEKRHLHRRDEQRALTDADLREIALSKLRKLWQMRRSSRKISSDFPRKPKPLKTVAQLLAAEAQCQRTEGHIAGFLDGLCQPDAAVHLTVAFANGLSATHIERTGAVKDLRLICCSLRQCNISNERFNGRARRIHPVDRPVQQRSRLLLTQAIPVRFYSRRIIGRATDHSQHGTGLRVEHHGGTAAPREGIIGGLLDICIDGELHIIAAVCLEELCNRAQARKRLCPTEQILVGMRLHACAANPLTDVSCHRRHCSPHGITSLRGRCALRERPPFRIEQGTALNL